MKIEGTEKDFFYKIHQICSLEYENKLDSAAYVRPFLELLVKYKLTESRTLLANIIYSKDSTELDLITQMYIDSSNEGDPCAMYNLYLIYGESGDLLNARKYFDLARKMNFPFAIEEGFLF